MKVDEFLNHQQESGFEILATIEPIPGRPDCVKVTPYSSGGGCRCSSSFTLEVSHIENVEPTGQVRWCCGKHLKVAKVIIRKTGTVPVGDVIAGALRRNDDGDEPGGSGCATACADAYRWCKRRNGKDCRDRYFECLQGCGFDPPYGPLPE